MKEEDMIRRKIISNAKILFNRYGVKKTSLKEIAGTLDKGKNMLYHYFPSKLDLFLEVATEETKELSAHLQNGFARLATERQKLKFFLFTQFKIPTNYISLQTLLKYDVFGKMDIIKDLREEYFNLQIETVQQLLNAGINSKEFKSLTKDQTATISYTIIACINSIEYPFHFNPKNINLPVGLNAIIDIMISGLTSVYKSDGLPKLQGLTEMIKSGR
jgi:AcrR family transcriptional regulator